MSRTLCCAVVFLTVLSVSMAVPSTTVAPQWTGKSVTMELTALPGQEVIREDTFKDLMLTWWSEYCSVNSTNKCGYRPTNSSINATAYYIDDFDEPERAEPVSQNNVPVDIKLIAFQVSDDKKSAKAEFVVVVGDAPLEPDSVAIILKDNADQINNHLGVEKTDVTVPKQPTPPGSMGWIIAIVVVVVAMFVVLMVGLVIALRRRQRTDDMFNMNTRAQGDGSQYLGQRPLSQSFDNAAYNSSTQTVRIGSFDEKK